jgi:hypothetical protein
VVRSRGADSAAGSLRRLPHRPRDVPAARDVAEASRGESGQARFARTPVLKYQVTTGLSQRTELLNWLNGLALQFQYRASRMIYVSHSMLTVSSMPDYAA